jgi:DNA-binding response OmpR family regulator
MSALVSTLERNSLKHPLIPQRRILLIDPEAADRDRYAQHLRDQGLRVFACSSYEEGARCLERERFDLVIVDQGGPAFEGKVIAERSMIKDRKVPVLVTTRYHHMAAYVEAMQLGAVEYLEKPIPLHEFLWRIGTYLPSGWVKTQRPS